jgi:hypothetical protein
MIIENKGEEKAQNVSASEIFTYLLLRNQHGSCYSYYT